MKETSKDFLKTLFNEGEQICISSDAFAYKSVSQNLDGNIELISNNPTVKPKIITEDDINFVAINPINGPRNDNSVTAFRSFLIELDEGGLEEQAKYVEESGMPYSVCVFSGGKSLHYGVVVDDPYPHINTWKMVNQWILNIMSKADQQNKNPSKMIRFPGNIRKENNKKQILIHNRGRVKKEDLNIWLNKHLDKKPKKRVRRAIKSSQFDITKIPNWIKDHYDNGVLTDRNKTWFNIACWFAEYGNFDENKFIDTWDHVYIEENDFKRHEWEGAIKSAFKRIQGGG